MIRVFTEKEFLCKINKVLTSIVKDELNASELKVI